MNSTLEKKENNKVTLKFEVDHKKFEEAVQKAYLKNRGKFNVPGFRKGKVPKKIIESRYGEGVFYEDAINIVLPDAYEYAIEENDLEPMDRPDIDIEKLEKGENVVFTAEVTVKPEVKLGDYKRIEIEKVEYNVSDEDVENELKTMQDRNSRLIEVEDRSVEEGDTVVIDYAGYVDEEQFEGGTAENQSLEIGSGQFIPGFEEQLIGKNKDEKVEVNVTFPEDYQAEELKGKEAKFDVTIHEIKEKELPELDDEFAKDVSEFDTLEELKKDIKEKLETEAKNKEKFELENKIIEKVIENAEMDIPEVMIDVKMDNEIRNLDYKLRQQGLDLDKYLELTNTKVEDLKEQLKPNAEKMVQSDLVLEAVGKEENIQVSDEDVDNELKKYAEQYNQDVDKFRKNLREEDLESIKMGIIKTKTVEFLVENVKLS
ncbi:trigger factor [Clostridium sp. D2Q-14]|uniref:trigger factor n=1 Tax=Anaeromonas gelatinilytica TaxID=2683194 RepID=UPI00193B6AB7|nr:trigger factor [Anaeromonas gelatinilytica]MBS4535813.1 trigger factor [Anaeromonas gelatinilytica]